MKSELSRLYNVQLLTSKTFLFYWLRASNFFNISVFTPFCRDSGRGPSRDFDRISDRPLETRMTLTEVRKPASIFFLYKMFAQWWKMYLFGSYWTGYHLWIKTNKLVYRQWYLLPNEPHQERTYFLHVYKTTALIIFDFAQGYHRLSFSQR